MPDTSELDGIEMALTTRFIRGVSDQGGRAGLSGQDLRWDPALAVSGLAGYCFKGLTIRTFADGARTPMAILNDLEATGEGHDLWAEFTDAARKSRRQMTRSKGIDKVCADGPHHP